MLIKRRRGWELGENRATPESLYLQRRSLVKAMGLGAASLALPAIASAQDKDKNKDPSAALYTAKRNDKYGVPTPMTAEKLATTYNNFYEFGTDKSIWRDAQKLEVRPWTIKVSGMVEKPFEIGIDDLLAKVQLEERVYRHRCVEAWSMIVPWSGFPMRSLVELCKPASGAKFVVMKTLSRPSVMREQRDLLYPWPYTEADPQAERRAAAHRDAVEVRLQEREVDRFGRIQRQAAGLVLGEAAGERVRLLGQREPAGAASALEPGDREAAGQRRAHPHPALQRLRRVRVRALRRPQSGKALHMR